MAASERGYAETYPERPLLNRVYEGRARTDIYKFDHADITSSTNNRHDMDNIRFTVD